MKIYVATLIERCSDGQLFIQNFADMTPDGLAVKVDEALSVEEREQGIEIPRDFDDLLIECTNGSFWNEPLSIGEDANLSSEFLLVASIKEV